MTTRPAPGHAPVASRRQLQVDLLAPSLLGADGVSTVTRAAWTALRSRHDLVVRGHGLFDSAHDLGTRAEGFRGAGGRRRRLVAWALGRSLGAGRDTLVVAMHLHLAPATLPAALRGARTAVFLHGIEAWTPASPLRRFAMARADLILTNSRYTWSRAVEANPFLRGRTARVCPLGVDPPLAPGPLPRGLQPGFVLVVGRMHEGYKGHDELLDLWPEVLTSRPGAPPAFAADGPHRARHEARARRLGLEATVTFTGRVPDDTLSALYAGCAFFAMPSRGEGFGLVFLEAMRAGKACVAAKGAAEEVVVDHQTGLIVDPDRPTDLRRAVLALLDDAELRDRLGRSGHERWRAQFTSEAFGRRLLAALDLEQG